MSQTPLTLPKKLVVALGGNAIHPAGIKGTGKEQFAIAAKASDALLPLLRDIPELVITHGNGPGVGKVLMRQAIARQRVASMPLDICVANSQGGISYVIMQCVRNTLQSHGIMRSISSLVCEVEVDPADIAFSNPDKPLGYFFSESEAQELTKEFGWIMKEDANRGWRMVVPSPKPKKIINSEVVRNLSQQGVIVITGGGGGIPVNNDGQGNLSGLEAVVDKDLTSALLARDLGIEHLLILTSTDHVSINYGTKHQQELKRMTVDELEKHMADDQFSAGSMGPKVEAVINFLRTGGKLAIIAHLENAYEALLGKTGTQVVHG